MRFLSQRNSDDSDVDVDSVLSNLHRLQEVQASNLLDQPRRPALDGLTRSARETTGAEFVSVSIIDDRRHFFASEAGLPEAIAEQREIDLDHTYCKYVVAYEDTIVISDSLTSPLVAENLATTEGGLRSYLGVPLRRNGQVIGSFCLMNTAPRQWSQDDLSQLQEFAQSAEAEINAR